MGNSGGLPIAADPAEITDKSTKELIESFTKVLKDNALGFYPDWPTATFYDELNASLQELVNGSTDVKGAIAQMKSDYDKGVQDAMAEGFLAGYPMVDIKCACYDGSYHSVDSNEMAFKTAARIGFRAACEKADPVVLEPMASLSITVPEEYAGTVMGDVSTRRGRIVGTDAGFAAGETIIKMRAPYAEVINYTKDLRSMTRGSGSYSLVLEGYEAAPADVARKLVEAYETARAAGN